MHHIMTHHRSEPTNKPSAWSLSNLNFLESAKPKDVSLARPNMFLLSTHAPAEGRGHTLTVVGEGVNLATFILSKKNKRAVMTQEVKFEGPLGVFLAPLPFCLDICQTYGAINGKLSVPFGTLFLHAMCK